MIGNPIWKQMKGQKLAFTANLEPAWKSEPRAGRIAVTCRTPSDVRRSPDPPTPRGVAARRDVYRVSSP
jgi:hypothetical protein